MFHYLYALWGELLWGGNLLRYVTFRSICAFLTAFLLSFLLGPRIIRWLKSKQAEGQPIREDGPPSHLLTKQGTPTMGGCLILLGTLVGTLLWGNLANNYLWWVLFVTLGFGFLGGVDDYLKLARRNTKGVSGTRKLIIQFTIAIIASLGMMQLFPPATSTLVFVPFFKNVTLDLGLFYPLFTSFVIVGTSNAVNLTDGLDGLAIGPIIVATSVFSIIVYLIGHSVFSTYLQVPHMPGVGELAIICAALVGASLGFLWYNAPPAMIFMGDTGSLAVGGCLGTISVASRHEIILAFVGGVFVLEALSVMLQVGYYKRTKKRIFLMAPLHHHFEKKGWSESAIVFRFWIIAIILGILGLATLKIR